MGSAPSKTQTNSGDDRSDSRGVRGAPRECMAVATSAPVVNLETDSRGAPSIKPHEDDNTIKGNTDKDQRTKSGLGVKDTYTSKDHTNLPYTNVINKGDTIIESKSNKDNKPVSSVNKGDRLSRDTERGSGLNKTMSGQAGEDKDGQLYMQIINGDVDRVRALLSEGANPNKVAGSGMTPVHLAILIGNRDMILTLLGADNVNVNAKTMKEVAQGDTVVNEGSNVLHLLAHRGNQKGAQQFDAVVEVTKALKVAIDVAERDAKDQTPADIAKMSDTVMVFMAVTKAKNICKKKAALKKAAQGKAAQGKAAEEKAAQQQVKEAVKSDSPLTDEEKQQVLVKTRDFMSIKFYPVMVHLIDSGVVSDDDIQHLAERHKQSHDKAVEYFLQDIILKGPYAHLKFFYDALIAENQENLAATLPIRD